MKRGDVWWADLDSPKAGEPGFRRPVVVVQDDLLTASALSTVMVVPLTSNLRRGVAAGNVELEAGDTGLRAASVALVCQVTTADRSWLSERAGALPRRAMQKIDAGLRLALGLAA